MRVGQIAVVFAVLVFAGLGAPGTAGPSLDPKTLKTLETLEGIVRGLGKAGLLEEARFLVEILISHGLPAEDAEKLKADVERRAAKARQGAAARARPRMLLRFQRMARDLAKGLEERSKAARVRLARLILQLDGSNEAAHAALDHKKVGDRWLGPDEVRLLKGRKALQEVLRRARRLRVPVTVAGRADPLVAEITGKLGSCVKTTTGIPPWTVELHAATDPRRLTRILQEGLRALAIAQWILDGELQLPEIRGLTKFILFRNRGEYQAVWLAMQRCGFVSRRRAERALEYTSFHFDQGGDRWVFAWGPTEAGSEATILWFLDLFLALGDHTQPSGQQPPVTFSKVQACLRLGLCELVALAFLGTEFGPIGLDAEDEAARWRTLVSVDEIRLWLIRMYPMSGMAGHRRLMFYLARQGLDPPWARSMVDHPGKIRGNNRMKTISMVQFLAEHGPLGKLFHDSRSDAGPGRNDLRVQAMETALGERLDSLELRWRTWILAEKPRSMTAMLKEGDADGGKDLTANESALLEYLSDTRGRASLDPVSLDRGLSLDALRHARYLAVHRDQRMRWPDMHEEYPDREGYSPGGCWAGLHSVIMPGHRSPSDSVDGWMGTFYHRLPLLHPGLIKVGWGVHQDVAVLDVCSLVIPLEEDDVTVVWPCDGAEGVPLDFQPELPNPVPAKDQSLWGYPVTVQRWRKGAGRGLRLTMSLHKGSAYGPLVDCHFSSPQAPTNPDVAPHNAWCLIPKTALEPDTVYWVKAWFEYRAEPLVWKFKTGW